MRSKNGDPDTTLLPVGESYTSGGRLRAVRAKMLFFRAHSYNRPQSPNQQLVKLLAINANYGTLKAEPSHAQLLRLRH
jgi:hypothetical protein